MTCKHLVYRSKNYIKHPYCRLNREWQPICTNCQNKSYKVYKPLKKSDKPITKRTNKQRKLEDNRYSIFTNDLKHCIENKDHKGHIDKHEVYEGKNRIKSIKYGLVIPVCRNCHEDKEVIEKWQVIGRQAFIKEHGEELFTKEFQTKKGIKE